MAVDGDVVSLFSQWGALFLASEDVYKDYEMSPGQGARACLDREANALHSQMMEIEAAILGSGEAPSARTVYCKLSLAWAIARHAAQPEALDGGWVIVESALADMRGLTAAAVRAE